MSSKYWASRLARTQIRLTNKSIRAVEKQMRQYYAKTMDTVINGFESTYNKLIATVEAGHDPTPADLYKLDKYWQLQAQIRRELEKMGNRQIVALSKQFEINWFDIYYSIALDGKTAYTTLDTNAIQAILNTVWCADGKTWKERIWTNTSLLQEVLNDNLIDCVVAGKKTTQLKELLEHSFEVSYHRADALVRTELAHIQTTAAQQRYKDYGIEQVEVFVDEDERTCPICGKHEGDRHSVNSVMPVPFHPRCRCCMIPVIN